MEIDQSLFSKSRMDVRANVFPNHIDDVQQHNIRGWVYDVLNSSLGPSGQPLTVDERITYITRLNALFDANPIWLENIVGLDLGHANSIVHLCVFGSAWEFHTDFLIQLNPLNNVLTSTTLGGIRLGWRTTPMGIKGRWSWLLIRDEDLSYALSEISEMLDRYHTNDWRKGFEPMPSDAIIFQKMMGNRFAFTPRGENIHSEYIHPVNTGDDTSDQGLQVS